MSPKANWKSTFSNLSDDDVENGQVNQKWIFSYASFMMLLVGFFVLYFSVKQGSEMQSSSLSPTDMSIDEMRTQIGELQMENMRLMNLLNEKNKAQ